MKNLIKIPHSKEEAIWISWSDYKSKENFLSDNKLDFLETNPDGSEYIISGKRYKPEVRPSEIEFKDQEWEMGFEILFREVGEDEFEGKAMVYGEFKELITKN